MPAPAAAAPRRGGPRAPAGAGDGGEAERQAPEVAAGAVLGLAILLDGGEELAHRAAEPVVEPGPLERGGGAAVGRRQRHRLLAEVRPDARQAPQGSGHRRGVARAVGGRAVEGERGLAAVDPHQRLREQRRAGGLGASAGGGGVDALEPRPGERGQEVEPVDREVVEHEVADRLERRADDPGVIPVIDTTTLCRSPIRPRRTAARIQAWCGAQRPF